MENLGIDGKLLLAQLINFILFFIIYKKYIAKPFMAFLKKEKSKEEDKEKSLSNIKKIEGELETKEVEMRKTAKKEADVLITKAKEDAQRVRVGIIESANKEAAAIVEKGKKQIEEEKTLLYKEVKTKAADLSMLMVQKALGEYLTADAQKKVTEHILTNLSKDNA